MGHPQCRCADACGQDADRPLGLRRSRRCLLKGCERSFIPSRPQARYCSPSCQLAARRWRRWHASQRYRATAHGHERRRDQNRRYRVRRQQRPVPEAAAAMPPDPPPPPATAAAPATADAREGQRPAPIPEKSCGRPCRRPGCYDCFRPTAHEPPQRFCSAACRQALRRVEQREARWRQRRRDGIRPRPVRQRPPP